jgi:hypothetical protein
MLKTWKIVLVEFRILQDRARIESLVKARKNNPKEEKISLVQEFQRLTKNTKYHLQTN